MTLWGKPASHLHEYSYRLWGGMISTFYRPRWARWFAGVDAALANGTKFDQTAFDAELEAWEYAWTLKTGVPLPTEPAAGALQLARQVHARHFGAR